MFSDGFAINFAYILNNFMSKTLTYYFGWEQRTLTVLILQLMHFHLPYAIFLCKMHQVYYRKGQTI